MKRPLADSKEKPFKIKLVILNVSMFYMVPYSPFSIIQFANCATIILELLTTYLHCHGLFYVGDLKNKSNAKTWRLFSENCLNCLLNLIIPRRQFLHLGDMLNKLFQGMFYQHVCSLGLIPWPIKGFCGQRSNNALWKNYFVKVTTNSYSLHTLGFLLT